MTAKLEVQASFAEETFQGFLRGLKLHWKDDLYRRVVAKATALRANDVGSCGAAGRLRTRPLVWAGRVCHSPLHDITRRCRG